MVVKFAEECLVACNFGSSSVIRFWEGIRDEVAKRLPAPKIPKYRQPMTDAECKEFGKRVLPRGKFEDVQVDQVDLSYIDWWLEPDDFSRDLRRYRDAQRIKHEAKVAETHAEESEDEDE